MRAEYPEIIKEVIEKANSDEIRHFDLSSFMSDKSLEDVFEKIDRTMQFFSAYVFMELLEDDLWEDERYAEKEEVHLCSLVEAEARKYWWDRNREHLKLIDKRVEALKGDPEFKDVKEGDIRDKVIKDLDLEVYPIAIERVKEEYQELYEDEWEEYWKKEDPFRARVEYEYHRRYEMPRPFSHWDSRNAWQQYYFGKDQAGFFYYEQGGSGSSGQRYNHGFYGHLFALLSSEKPIPTYFFTYDSQNHFIFDRKENSLWLNFFDLVGNFWIDRKDSEGILRDVKKIERGKSLTKSW
ncbi:MAG: hypothetical protein KAV83_00755 [Desulfobacterales bacterium]|nr:hypothetical protein [Desulfobacterales bacterium]